MTFLIAVPTSLIMAVIVYRTDNLAYNFAMSLVAAHPVAFFCCPLRILWYS
ncbi:MAG: hypothetical protein ACW981_18345 [Candidatus Hodarchaeales archaeon]